MHDRILNSLADISMIVLRGFRGIVDCYPNILMVQELEKAANSLSLVGNLLKEVQQLMKHFAKCKFQHVHHLGKCVGMSHNMFLKLFGLIGTIYNAFLLMQVVFL